VAVGRDPDEIGKTTSGEILIRDAEKELRDFQIASGRGDNFEAWQESNFVGTPEQVANKVQRFIDVGCTGFIPWCVDYPDTHTLDAFAKIMQNYR
jgi:alkanesulfonate monooxygenase SsuD/methylene tetrahydromethanopterin reductase-like flavin-dependent oxidoreductase (luciferase family)